MSEKLIDEGALEEVSGGGAILGIQKGPVDTTHNTIAVEKGNTGGGTVLLGGAPFQPKAGNTDRISGGPVPGTEASAGWC